MLKQTIYSLWMGVLVFVCCAPVALIGKGGEIVNDTERILATIHMPYVDYVKNVRGRLKLAGGIGSVPFFGKMVVGIGAALGGHTTKDLEHAKRVTKRFFNSGRYVSIAQDIGNSPEDSAYVRSVFTELFNNYPQTFERLKTIMHHRMMNALGLPLSMTIGEFCTYMERANKKGYYIHVHGQEFETYARLIALNLFITYWYDTHVA